MSDQKLQLKTLVASIYPLSDADHDAFLEPWSSCSMGRKETISNPGEPEKYLYFVISGVQRVYYFDSAGREATLVFTYPPSFGGVLDALLLRQPSRYYYETLTASEFLRIGAEDLFRLMEERPAIEKMIRQGLTIAMAGVMERLVELQCYSSTEKFKTLLKRSPQMLRLVPHKYLANYIGIDPTNFSKLMNTVTI